MAKRLSHRKGFQASLMGVFLVICLLWATDIRADGVIPYVTPPEVKKGLKGPQPVYLSSAEMREKGSPILTSRKPITPFKIDESSYLKAKPITKFPVGIGTHLPSKSATPMKMTAMPGKTVFVYDNLNRIPVFTGMTHP